MKKAFLAIAAVGLLLATADTASADHRDRRVRSGWSVGVGYGGGFYGGYPYGGYGWGGPGFSAAYGTRVGSRGFASVGYSSGWGGYGYGPAYGYGYPAYGYGYAPVYAAPVYAAPVYYSSPYYYGGGPSIGFSYSRWR